MHYACNWRGGITPGNDGSSLITGHAWAKGHSKFNQFPDIQLGDLIHVTTPAGKLLTFKVMFIDRTAPHALTEQEQARLRSPFGPPRLGFYTCNAQNYDFQHSRYRNGVVVEAKLVPTA